MQKKIDMGNSEGQRAAPFLNERDCEAIAAAARFNNFVRPVYSGRGNLKPVQIGSCVLLRVRNSFFVLSAAHVFEPNIDQQFFVGCGTKLHELAGARLRSAPGPSGSHYDDPVDAAVIHLKGGVDDEIVASCMSVDDFDFNSRSDSRYFCVAKGYRSKRSRVVDYLAKSELDTFSVLESSDGIYSRLDVDRVRQIALAYADKFRVGQIGERWQKSPKPVGMSGGAILRVIGIPEDPEISLSPPFKALLAAILIEYRPSAWQGLPVIVGTRIDRHWKLISKHFLDLEKSTAEILD